MQIDNLFYFYQLVNHLVDHEKFEIVYIHKSQTEVWLQRKNRYENQVIRLTQSGFDWKNQLKADYKHTIYQSEKLAPHFLGRHIKLYNVYVSQYAPVDDWEDLKYPSKLRHHKFKEIETFYIDKENRQLEQSRFFRALEIDQIQIESPENIWEQERMTQQLRAKLVTSYNKQQRDRQRVFQYGKPLFTYVILGLNVLMFLWLELQGGSTDTEVLIEYGAKYNPAILRGEWWRIVSSMFLHIGLLHLMMNMLALHVVGTVVERIYGNTRFFIIYFIAGIVGGVTSFAFSPQVAAGASGAIFGLFGALLYFGINHKRIFFQTMGWNVIGVILFNIIFGLVVPQIDNGAHIGGLLGGFLAAAIVYFPKKKKSFQQIAATMVTISLTFLVVDYGLSNESVQQKANQFEISRQLQRINEFVQQEDYELIIHTATTALEQEPNKYQAELLFYRSYAYLYLEQTSNALSDLQELVRIAPNKIPEAHYNLALIYLDRKELKKAKTALEKAIELRPNNETFTSLYQETFEES
ncbi:Rhomboid protease GluP [Paraliobacillus sp. PM-2]|uniref:rhomboid family intramembrane serine protease n=1 Tax=Paraliobacillus sp. PM-2 TaxID=1462524 RepID=UPI00061BE54B|nr:rhomboid family intramembrane serine protease [Paraliobacillus sp. PM-2]CQR46845.1 Rhomboid protease GluP [Paraliobacillus sp. PM-2]